MFNRLKYAAQGRSAQWSKVRKMFLKIRPKCEACTSSHDLEVHHIKPFHIYPDLELEQKNLMTLCRHCHLVLGHLRDFDIYNRNARIDVDSFYIKRMEALILATNLQKVKTK